MASKPRTTKAKGNVGRPSVLTEEIRQRILDGLTEGKSLRKICKAEGMPDPKTVYRAQAADDDFAAKCARAREAGQDALADALLDLSDGTNSSNFNANRVKASIMQWHMTKVAPKKYGDRIQHDHDVVIRDPEQLKQRLNELIEKATPPEVKPE